MELWEALYRAVQHCTALIIVYTVLYLVIMRYFSSDKLIPAQLDSHWQCCVALWLHCTGGDFTVMLQSLCGTVWHCTSPQITQGFC